MIHHPMCQPTQVASASNSRRPSQTSGGSGDSGISSIEGAVLLSDQLHTKTNQHDVFTPACWPSTAVSEPVTLDLPARPSLSKLESNRPLSCDSTPLGVGSLNSNTSFPNRPGNAGISSSARTISACDAPGDIALNPMMPSSIRRPREGIQPDFYPFETPAFTHPKLPSDPAELTMERMGENATKEVKLERFREFVVFALRGFGSFATLVGTGCYGPELESSLRRQSSTHKELLVRNGIRVPLTNRIAKACPLGDWGIEYGATANPGTLVLNDFVPWPSTKLDEFRLVGDKPEVRGKQPAGIYLVNAAMEPRNKFSERPMGWDM